VEGGGGGLTVSGVSRNRGSFVKCVAIQKRLGIPAVYDIKYLFELSLFTNTSYCETTHRLTSGFLGVLSLPYIRYYFTFNES
jgi:hypothetical protein